MFSLKLLLFLVYFQWNTLKRLYTWQVIHCDYTRDQICIMFLLLITMVQWHIINTKFTAVRFQKQENLSGWIKESFFYSWQIISSFLDTHFGNLQWIVVYQIIVRQIERLQVKPWGPFLSLFKGLKSLQSDQHQFSSLNIITKSNGKVIRFHKMITYTKKLKSFIKFSYWFFKTTYSD